MSLAAASSSPPLRPPDEPSLAPPLPDLLRSDSVGTSRPTSGLTLQRTLDIHFPMLSRFMFEAELFPLLTLSKAMHSQIRKEIVYAQSQERLRWHRMRVEIEEQLACLKAVRSHLSASEQDALDVEATASCRSLVTAATSADEFTRPLSGHCRSLIERGGRVFISDDELQRNLSGLVRMLVQEVEPMGQPTPAAAADSCSALVEFLKMCFLSNPLLWRNKQYIRNGRYTLLEMLMETMLSRFTFSFGPRKAIRMHAARATTEMLSWLIQLMLLQPPFHCREWRHADQHLLLLCTEQITKRECVTSAEMTVAPFHSNDLVELKQLRWSIVRQCAGGPDAHSTSQTILRLNGPLMLPSFHPHALVFHHFYSVNADPTAVCVCCGLDDEQHSLLFDVFVCAQCDFRLHSGCVVTTQEAQERGFQARTAAEVHRTLQKSASDSEVPSSNAQLHLPIPASVLDDLRSWFHRMFDELPSVGSLGLMTLLLDSSHALCQSMQAALSLGPLPRDRRSSQRSMLRQWSSGWMKNNRARQRLLKLLSGQSRFRSMVLRLDDRPIPAAQDLSGSTSSSSSSSSKSLSLSFFLLFDLIRRKERQLLAGWLKKDRACFITAWPQLVDPITGCSPLHYLVAHVRGCRQRIFTLLARFTCNALRLKPADLLSQRNAAGQSLAELLERDYNHDLREEVSASVEVDLAESSRAEG